MRPVEVVCDKCGGKCTTALRKETPEVLTQTQWAARGPQRIGLLVYRPLVEVSTCDDCGHSVSRSEQVTTWMAATQ